MSRLNVLIAAVLLAAAFAAPALARTVYRFTVTADVANVRSAPSTAAPVVGQLRRAEHLAVSERRGDWVEVSYSAGGLDRSGWVHGSLGDIIASDAPGGASGSGADFGSGGLALLLLLLGAGGYFLPLIVAGARGHHQAAAIAVLNIFLGWTFLGWVVALVWASTAVRKGSPAPSAEG